MIIARKLRSFNFLVFNFRFYALLRIDLLRFLICRMRRYYYTKVKKTFKRFDLEMQDCIDVDSKDGQKSTLDYNLEGLTDVSGARSLRLIRPLSVIETYRPLYQMPIKGGVLYDQDYHTETKVLTVGPRTEGEVFCLMAYGFKPENIKGLDLFSYSPYIDVGDMHQMPYDDHSFDIVLFSCVLVYSQNPKKAAMEALRVVKSGGLIGIAQDIESASHDPQVDYIGRRLTTCEDYLELFGKQVKKVFFSHDLPEKLENAGKGPDTSYTCSLIFQVQKP